MKRYIYIIIGIVVLAAIAILILFLIKNNSGAPSVSLSGGTTSGTLPTTGTQGVGNPGTSSGLTTGSGVATLGLPSTTGTSSIVSRQMAVLNFGVLSQNPVLDYFVDAQNNITAIEPTGVIFSVSNGQSTVINSSTLAGIISAHFSYDGKKIVVSYGDPANPQGTIFDVTTQAWTALPQGMQSPQWSPADNYQIAYLAPTASGKLDLATINAAALKTAPSVLLALAANDFTLQWPSQGEFILSDKPTSQNAGSIWAFNSKTITLTPLVYETPGAEGIWSSNTAIPYGLVFFNDASGQGNALQLQAISGSLPTQPLSFSTLPSKCTFNTELMAAATSTATSTSAAATSTPYLALYCGIPRSTSGFSSARLPDDYNTMALFTSDDIYKINTATGETQSLWSDGTQNMDVSDMKFFNNALFFVNRYDSKLYGLTFSNN